MWFSTAVVPDPTALPLAVLVVICAVMIEAAIIDGWKLKVPNWLTYNFLGAGILYWTVTSGWAGFQFAMLGFLAGFVLYPLCLVGGMGAGDVKLLFGIGAWTGWYATLVIFALCAVVGGIMAVIMMAREGQLAHRLLNLQIILSEWWSLKNPENLEKVQASALERKQADLKKKMLLPYGIPMVIAAVSYLSYIWVDANGLSSARAAVPTVTASTGGQPITPSTMGPALRSTSTPSVARDVPSESSSSAESAVGSEPAASSPSTEAADARS
ncbi:peptidase A24A prepilin type IV [Isosphaera pallida ATCC 43644]|uniref:Peptidase A24A prepilin type IV n=1 Tax=Isosphaera pallida (strain ATCC 43644 / DSM 9630 / IS1B) TaxID=575540 RepID=E8R637_ISOPI|nr:A24 family peptidase [Isosphaera pallida]ADV60732.1 peptidase A24A prepilin type IV [Isosphaera pallida ATCC 43644]